MRYSLFLLAAGSLLAQQQSFDAFTYTPPPGYSQRAHARMVEFSRVDQQKKYYCQIGIYQAQPSTGSARQDFDAEWKAVVASQFKVAGKVDTRDHKLPNAPESVFGVADATGSNGNKVINTLFVVRFPGRYVGILFNTPNDEAFQACQKDAINMAASVQLTGSPAPVAAPAPASLPGSPVGTWERVTASQIATRYNPFTKQWESDPVAAMNQFRQVRRFRFEANGQYEFELDAEDYNRSQRSRVFERGTYTIDNGSIRFRPVEMQDGKGPRGQNPPMAKRAVPAGHARKFLIGEHPQYQNSAGLQLSANDGGWETYKPVR
jgi:hypothetical protein